MRKIEDSAASGAETMIDFYVILPDQDFTEKTGGIVKRGIIRSESLKGKFHRKLGSVEVLRHSEALSDEWIRKLYPGLSQDFEEKLS
jgi:hypothetical protein